MEEVKNRNRNIIIKAASKIALQKGFYNTSLEEIAQASNLTKRTILNIFETKTNLILETIYDAQLRYFSYMDEFVTSEGFQTKSGLEQIISILIKRAQYYYEEPMRARIIQHAESLRPKTEREKVNCKRYYREYHKIEEYYYEPVRKGKQDGSIRSGIEEEAIANLLFLCFGAIVQRLSEWNENPYVNKTQDLQEVLRETLRVIRRYLSND